MSADGDPGRPEAAGADAGGPGAEPPRVVLVETSDALPGLLPFQAWDALAAASVVHLRDPDTHPSARHLYFAGLDLEALAPATLGRAELDLTKPGSPEDRRIAKALLEHAAREGVAVYLLGPGDEGLGPTLGGQAPAYEAEVEFVFLVQQPAGAEFVKLVDVLRRLRDPEHGCPWDLEQDHRSLQKYLVEETYELIDAIERGHDLDIQEELGDVLLQVVFHAQVARDRGAFAIDDVTRGIVDKLVRRHPHVFGDVEAATAQDVQRNWDELKAQEKAGRSSPFDGVPPALPGLMFLETLERKAAKRGFDWGEPAEPAARVREELDELLEADEDARLEEFGDLLGAVVGLARTLGVDPEAAARAAGRKFRGRFEAMLALAAKRELPIDDLSRDTWLELWDEVKSPD
ncbi:nucleoside triphosphate pyrophosphohydrolase [Egicoccus sp. AB-alg2]|uniref:nucleoside triphosphate pyrophosphohydrolase n=1 Tax=Egicoccus sp. AB-alg2 TaxID=3242693 RepID=UPI00359E6165